MLGSCSLSTVHVGGVDAGDIFGRVEAIPREHVIGAVDEHKTWTNCEEYIDGARGAAARAQPGRVHRPLRHARRDDGPGPRDAEAATADQERTGADGAVARRGADGRVSSECPLSNCFSTSSTATSAGRARCRRPTPSRANCVGSSPCCGARAGSCSPGPTSRTRSTSVSQVVQSLGLVRNPLKTSLLSAADVKSNPYAIKMMGPLARFVNRLGGNFRWQHLPVPFEVYADGIDLVIFEEFGAGAAALHLRDEVERNELLRDEAYRREFRKDYESKFGMRVWQRDFFDAEIVDCPDAVGGRQVVRPGRPRPRRTAPRRRVPRPGARARHGIALAHHDLQPPARRAQEAGPRPRHPDGLLRRRRPPAQHGVLQHGPAAAAPRPRRREGGQAVHDHRAGRAPAHRRTRRLVSHRRRPPAHRRPRRRRRSSTPSGSTRHWTTTPRSRSSSTAACPGWSTATTTPCNAVFVGGRAVFLDGEATDVVGKQRTGRFLRAAHKAPAVTAQESELASVS